MLTFMRRIAVIAMLGVLTCGTILLVSGYIFHFDDRRSSHSSLVGTLTIELPEGHGTGTAILVDECGILTAFHVVFGPWYVTALREPSHEFVAQFTLTEVTQPDGDHPSTRATPVVWGDYRGPDRQFRSAGEDWVYLVLDDCLGSKYGFFSVRPLEMEDLAAGSIEFSTIGYSSGRQMMDPRCRVLTGPAVYAGAWSNNCVQLVGDSGGPIFVRDTMTLIALSSSAIAKAGEASCASSMISNVRIRNQGATSCANLAVPLSPAIASRISDAMVAVGVQRVLSKLGYDPGPLGAVDEPEARAAIEEAQRSIGLSVTGEPSHALWGVLRLRASMI
ncbi:MAG TPA: peptidoglycan-binding domain-containing protein [Dongiaceae bacterium]